MNTYTQVSRKLHGRGVRGYIQEDEIYEIKSPRTKYELTPMEKVREMLSEII